MAKSEGETTICKGFGIREWVVHIQGQNMGFFLLKQSGIKFQVEG